MRISIVTVSFNSAATIADTLRSVAGQTGVAVEHIVVDGGSTDGTKAVIAREGAHLARWISEPDRGIYDAMNKGIGLATGDVVGFLNSDDFYPSSDVLSQVAATFADPAVDACHGDLCYVRREDPTAIVRYWRSSPHVPGSFTRGWVPPHPTFFVRRECYQRLGGFDLAYRIAADFELMARFLEVGHLRSVYIPRVLVTMRLGGTTNRSLRNVVAQNREIWRAMQSHRMTPSLAGFVFGKLASRGRQFFVRPA